MLRLVSIIDRMLGRLFGYDLFGSLLLRFGKVALAGTVFEDASLVLRSILLLVFFWFRHQAGRSVWSSHI